MEATLLTIAVYRILIILLLASFGIAGTVCIFRSKQQAGTIEASEENKAALTYLTLTQAQQLAKSKPMRRLLLNRPRGYSLLLIRRHAEAGLLRDGGMTATEVCRYVQELRHEVEQDVALRIRNHASSPVPDKSPTFVFSSVAFSPFLPS